MLPDDILIKIFTNLNHPFKLSRLSNQFNILINSNKNHIAQGILKRLGYKPSATESYRLYKNLISKHNIDNFTRDLDEAVKRGYTEIVELLLTDPNVNPSAGCNHAIR